jgi:hypothetical protein
MAHISQFSSQSQVKSGKNLCINKPKVLFEQVFCNRWVQELLSGTQLEWRNRVFSPMVTIWVFINQILNQDHSCRSAVSSLIALRSFLALPIVSTGTGAYCQARQRLPVDLVRQWARGAAQRLLGRSSNWLWKDFEVLLVDGSHLSLPDTPKNRKLYDLASHGHGLLKARVLGIFSLGCGCLLEFSLGPWKGKGTGEVSMFRALIPRLKKGQLVVMDRLFGSYIDMGLLLNHGLHFVVRSHASQKKRRGRHIGKNDCLIEINRPSRSSHRVTSMARQFLDLLPKVITVRQVFIKLGRKGFRTKWILIHTSLLDPKKYSVEEIGQLYAKRWHVEVDFRSLKIGLGLDVLRCKTPEMIEKEVWMHVLVYNMIRVIMAEAGLLPNLSPRQLSFQECVQLVEHFRILWSLAGSKKWTQLYKDLLGSLRSRVGNRPGRLEPRVLKHNPQKYNMLKMSRSQAREGYWKKGWAYNKRKREKHAA